MADPRLLNLSGVAGRMLATFQNTAWPGTLVFSGESSAAKHDFILQTIIDELYRGRKNPQESRALAEEMVKSGHHPDFYFFPAGKIAIGDPKDPEPGSIRHLLAKVLNYAPRNSQRRFVYFADASLINDEAESALLKSLEEPPPFTHFLLAVEESEQLKETIMSRAVEIPFAATIEPGRVSPEPWQRFWYLSGQQDSELYQLMLAKEWLPWLQETLGNLNYNLTDFEKFEDIGWNRLRKVFSQEKSERQSQIMRLSFLPLYFSLRDALLEGKMPTMGPVRIPPRDSESPVKMSECLQRFFHALGQRYFGTMPPNLNALFFSFLAEFMPLWAGQPAAKKS